MSNLSRWGCSLGLLLTLGCLPARAQQRTEPRQPGREAQQKEQQQYPAGVTVFGSPATPSSVSRSKPAASCPALVDQLMEVSGIDSQISQFPEALAHEIPDETRFTPVERRAVQTFFRVAGHAATYRAFVRRRLIDNCDPRMIEAAIHRDQTPLARKMHRLEFLFLRSFSVAQLHRFAVGLRARPPSQARIELTERLMRATDSVPVALQTAVATAQGVRSAIIGRRLTGSEKVYIAEHEEQLRPQIGQSVLVQMLFTYRQASEPQIERYVELMESWPFPKLNVLLGQAVAGAFRYQSDRAVAAALQARRSGR